MTRCPTCGGLNVPPRIPTAVAPVTADVAVALHDVLGRAQLAQADRAAGVELLRRVADLGAHAELAAVGEARRGVDVDAGGVDAQLERARRDGVPGHDRLRVAAAVGVDVLDRLLDGVDDLHGQHERQELLVPVRVASRRRARPPAPRRPAPACARRRAARRPRRAARRARAAGTPAAASAWTSSVSAALHTPGRWVLAFRTIALGLSRSAPASTYDVAVARRRVDHRHGRDALQRRLQALARRAG